MTIDVKNGITVTEANPGADCPHCHTPTETVRHSGPSLVGGLNMDEIETLVRNEWRRRLGPEAYHRRHSEKLVRALTVLAVHPRSPIVHEQIEASVRDALADLRAEGRGRAVAESEFWTLTFALRDVLTEAGMAAEQSVFVLQLAQQMLAEILYLPASEREPDE